MFKPLLQTLQQFTSAALFDEAAESPGRQLYGLTVSADAGGAPPVSHYNCHGNRGSRRLSRARSQFAHNYTLCFD
jgi:hypothetical protein